MEKYFEILINLLDKCKKYDEVPVSAIVVKNGRIIGKSFNKKKHTNVSVYHAEILAIIAAQKHIKDWRLDDCELYVTLKPCKMCEEVIRQARIKNVYYLLDSNFNNEDKKIINYEIISSKYSDIYKKMLKDFFKNKR